MKNILKTVSLLLCLLILFTGCTNVDTEIVTNEIISDTIVSETEVSSEQTTFTTESTQNVDTTEESTQPITDITTYNDIADMPTDFDKDFFKDDLFIGDSITTGFSGYGFIDENNIFAKVGLNPISILDTAIKTPDGDLYIQDEIKNKMPSRAYIMLGSNGIQWLDNDKMIEKMKTLSDTINDNSPDTEIIILSVPPITKEKDENSDTPDIMQKIRDYNIDLQDFCNTNNFKFIDITSIITDQNGYFYDSLSESDGMHFKGDTYKIVLSYIQRTMEN